MNVGLLYFIQDGVCLNSLFLKVIIPIEDFSHRLQMDGVFLLQIIVCQFLHLLDAFRFGLDDGRKLHPLESTKFFLVQLVLINLIKVGQDTIRLSGIVVRFRLS